MQQQRTVVRLRGHTSLSEHERLDIAVSEHRKALPKAWDVQRDNGEERPERKS
ncbi:hypothetical protein GCM10010518_38140 [Kitasatospora cinereorecta]